MTFKENFKACLFIVRHGYFAKIFTAMGIFAMFLPLIYFIPNATDEYTSFIALIYPLFGICMMWLPQITCFYTKLLAASSLRKFAQTTFYAAMTFLTLAAGTVIITLIILLICLTAAPFAARAGAAMMISCIICVGTLVSVGHTIMKSRAVVVVLYYIFGISLFPLCLFSLPEVIKEALPAGYELITAFALSILFSTFFSAASYFLCLKFYKKSVMKYPIKGETI